MKEQRALVYRRPDGVPFSASKGSPRESFVIRILRATCARQAPRGLEAEVRMSVLIASALLGLAVSFLTRHRVPEATCRDCGERLERHSGEGFWHRGEIGMVRYRIDGSVDHVASPLLEW